MYFVNCGWKQHFGGMEVFILATLLTANNILDTKQPFLFPKHEGFEIRLLYRPKLVLFTLAN